MKRTINLIIFLLIAGIQFGFAQTRDVSGRVTDESNGSPIIGATVKVKGTGIGAATDLKGYYVIKNVPKNAVLVFSYIGMETKEVNTANKKIVNVKLEGSAERLDRAIVIGYGKTTKEALTGSASVVGKDALAKVPTASLEKALQATTPGVQVSSSSGAAGAGATIRIRGIGSLTASSSPLWVVDGVVGAPTPHMEDVESMTVLKDAAASSIYGSRAANGVIIVTTKSGKLGRTEFEFQAKYGISNKTSKKFELLNSAEYYKVSWQGLYARAIANGLSDKDASQYAHKNLEGVAGRNPYDVAQPFDDKGNLVDKANLMIDQDWYELFNRTGITQQYDVSANGGNENTKFYFSIGYFDQDGIVKPDFYQKYTGQINLTNKVTDRLKIGFRSNFRRSSSDGVSGTSNASSTGYSGFALPNNVSLYELDDKFNVVKGEDGSPKYNWVNKVSQNYNPIGLAELNSYYTNSTSFFASTNLSYDITKDLVFYTSFSGTYSSSKTNNFETGDHGDALSDKGRSEKSSSESLKYISSSTLTYDKIFDDLHHVNALLGYEVEAFESTSMSGTAKEYEFNFSDELSIGAKPKSVNSSKLEDRMIGMFSRLNYDYDRKYYASFSIRRDASSKFAPDRRWGVFWSTSASWRLTQENFMQDITWINSLKLKASYGTNGNAGISSYLYMPLFALGGNYNDKAGIIHSQLSNNQLRWEKNIMANIGIDFRLFNVLKGSIEFFTRESDDLLSSKPLPYSTGWTSRTENIGGIKNTGFEIMLSSTNINNSDFKWVTDFNISHYKNEITELTQEQIITGSRVWKVGIDRYTWYLRDYAGVNKKTGAAQWYKDKLDKDGNIVGKELTEDYGKATRYELGTSLPDFYGALTNTLSYKDFTFSIQFYYSIGGKIYDSLEQMTMTDGSSYGHQLNKKVLNAWRADNDASDIPQFIYKNTSKSNDSSSRFLYDGSFVRLKNVNLAYNLPEKYANKIGLYSAKAFINIDNLYTFTKYKGLDPEQGISGTNSFSTIPNVRTITFGLRIGF